jgi:hypothetical protein
MNDQFCPQVNDVVPKDKCNKCNTDLVAKVKYCCKYINCLTTCDYAQKEFCETYREKLLAKNPL